MMTNYQNHYFCLPNLDFMKIAKGRIRFSRKDKQQFFSTLNKRVNAYFKDNNLRKKRKLEASSEESYFNNAFYHTICVNTITRFQSID